MAKNKQSNLIASVKVLNIDFINKHIINLGIGGGGYLALVIYQSLVLNFLLCNCAQVFRQVGPRQCANCLSHYCIKRLK